MNTGSLEVMASGSAISGSTTDEVTRKQDEAVTSNDSASDSGTLAAVLQFLKKHNFKVHRLVRVVLKIREVNICSALIYVCITLLF